MNVQRVRWISADAETKRRIMERAGRDVGEQMAVAASICEQVRLRGDNAVREYTLQHDGVEISPDALRVTEAEMAAAHQELPEDMKETIRYAARNIRRFHEAQRPQPMWMMEVDDGIMAGEQVTPIADVALYVPRGKGSFPSVMLMLGTPAVVAGVERIIVLTPPNERGGVDAAILFAANVLGLTEIYRVGGAQGVAAVAYGTASIPRCSKIMGPGNPYVTAAKRYLAGTIDPGVPAGPSESLILADEFADPHKAALDLLIEAEHGPDSAALLVTHSVTLADAVDKAVQEAVAQMASEQRRHYITTVLQRYGGIVLTESLDDSVAFANAYAPEHMEVLTRDPWALVARLKNAGEMLLGEWTPITLCNFLLGTNAILPTGGNAKTVSAVSLHDFLKRTSIGYATEAGFRRVREHAERFARWEGFEAHARAVSEREVGEETMR